MRTKIILPVAFIIMSIKCFATPSPPPPVLYGFVMSWNYTFNSSGSGQLHSAWDVCQGGTLFLKNTSNFQLNGQTTNVGNELTGYYQIWNAPGTSQGVLIGTIQASAWPGQSTISFQLPPNQVFNYSIGLNIRINYVGSDVNATPGNRYRLKYLTTHQPSVSAGNDVTICRGETATLMGSGATWYSWNPGNYSGTNVNVIPLSTTTYTALGTVIYNIQGSHGSPITTLTCNSTDNVTVIVNPLPEANLWQNNYYICEGQAFPTIYTNSSPAPSHYTFSWSYSTTGNKPFHPISNYGSSLNLNNFSLGTGKYLVTITNTLTGCTTNLSTIVSLDNSSISNINAGFNANQVVNTTANTISFFPTASQSGNHVWTVYNSDANQNVGSIINSYTTPSFSLLNLPLTGYYLIKHTLSRSPCNQPKTVTLFIHHGVSGLVINELMDDEISSNSSSTKKSITAIDNSINTSKINIFPNPINSSGEINISFETDNQLINEHCELNIYNVQGEIVGSKSLDMSIVNKYDATNLSRGVYYFKISQNNETLKLEKIVK